MSKKTKKVLWITVPLAVVAAATIFMALRKKDDGALAVEVAPAGRQEIVQKVSAIGRIQPVTQVDISADVSAKITALPVEEGQWVERGQLLVSLDREQYLAAVESAQANLRSAQAEARLAQENMVKAQKDYERTSELHGKSLESQSALDSAYAAQQVERARYQSALDRVEQVRGSLKQAQDSLSKTDIYAPMSGTISKLNKEVGEIALGSQFQSDVIMVLSNLEGMEALVDVDENDVVSVSLGDVATVEVDALPGQTFEGVVTEIANSANVAAAGTTEQKTEFEVKVAIKDPSAELRPGMTASADIVVETRQDALAVPIQSVSVRTMQQVMGGGEGDDEGGGGHRARPAGDEAEQASGVAAPELHPDKDGFVEMVWVVEDGRAVARQVETGIQSDAFIEIAGGLEEGQQVVVGNYRAISKDLSHGAAVTTAGKDGEGGPGGESSGRRQGPGA